ncbi:MAG: integrase [Gammaproteobacteria bacterium]|nr:MAG: integrase [Gammaproteobacteria bacterium]
MGHIRVRKETNKLYFDFMYRNTRCREQTTLVDSPANRKKLHKVLDHIDAQILLNQFDYQQQFPQSKMVSKLEIKQNVVKEHLSSVPTFKEFANTWFNEAKVGWRLNYIRNVSLVINNRLIPDFGEDKVDEVTKADLLQFRSQLSEVKQKNGDLLSASHINRHMKILRMIFNEAADRFNFSTPYRNIKLLKVPITQIEVFTLEEANSILSNVNPDFKSYYTVRFFTGMRSSEINGLKWRYIDFKQKLIMVRESWRNGQSEYTKNDSSQREIHMSGPVYDALLAQKQKTGQFDFVFTNRLGRPLDQTNLANRIWYPVLNKLGLRKRVQYQTRHTAATLWLASGENPEWIARQMGHSSTQMLFKVYSRFVPNLTRQDGSAFERLLLSSTTQDHEHEKH